MTAGLFSSIADPTDLDRVRDVIAASPDPERLVALGIRHLGIGPDVTAQVADELAASLRPGTADPARVLLLVDATPILRDGEDLKARVEADLGERFAVERLVLGHGDHLLADDEALDAATAAVQGFDGVVSVGGGTITDVGKVATDRAGGIPLVVVQTAASVDGFTDNVSVVLVSGVKRTIPSRWPDVVLADTTTIRTAPAEMNSAGLGEVLSLYTAPADWRLASLLGLDGSFHETPRDLLLAFAGDPSEWAVGLSEGDPQAVLRLTQVLAIRGIGTGIAGTTACLSGVEHVVSHMLDMHAAAHDLPVGLHGAQVGAATLVASAAWHLLLDRLEQQPSPALVELDRESQRRRVEQAFARVDGSGRQGAECWRDYSTKLDAVDAARERIEQALREWPAVAAEFRGSIPTPETLAVALHAADSPSGPDGLEDWIDEGHFRWAVQDCLYMRNRFTVADLLLHLGWWTDAEVDTVLNRARSAAAAARA